MIRELRTEACLKVAKGLAHKKNFAHRKLPFAAKSLVDLRSQLSDNSQIPLAQNSPGLFHSKKTHRFHSIPLTADSRALFHSQKTHRLHSQTPLTDDSQDYPAHRKLTDSTHRLLTGLSRSQKTHRLHSQTSHRKLTEIILQDGLNGCRTRHS